VTLSDPTSPAPKATLSKTAFVHCTSRGPVAPPSRGAPPSHDTLYYNVSRVPRRLVLLDISDLPQLGHRSSSVVDVNAQLLMGKSCRKKILHRAGIDHVTAKTGPYDSNAERDNCD